MQHRDDRKRQRLLADARQCIRDCSRRRVSPGASSAPTRPAPDRAHPSSSEPRERIDKLLRDLQSCPPKGSRLVTKDPSDFFPIDWAEGCVRVPPIVLPHALKVDSLRYEVLRNNLVEAVLAGERLQCGALFNIAEFRDAFWLMQDLLVAFRAKHDELDLHAQCLMQTPSFAQALVEQNVDRNNASDVETFARYFRVTSTSDLFLFCGSDPALMCSVFVRAIQFVKHRKDLPDDWQVFFAEYASSQEEVEEQTRKLRRLQDPKIVGRHAAARNAYLDENALVDLNWMRVTERMLILAYEQVVVPCSSAYEVIQADVSKLSTHALRPITRRTDQFVVRHAIYPLFPYIGPTWFAAQYIAAYGAAENTTSSKAPSRQLPGQQQN